jgi:opacity protein-like surface antigen
VRALLAAAAFLFTLAAPAGAQEAESPPPAPVPRPSPGPWRISVLRGFVAGATRFTETRTFTEFAEEGRIESRYEQDPGPGFEVGAGRRFGARLGVSAAVTLARRNEAGSFAADLPHPLYFGQPRQASGTFAGRNQKETAVHLDLALAGEARRLQWTVFAGPSLAMIDTDLVRSVEYTQAYPYDTVTVTGTPFDTVSGHALGFNVGGGLAWPAARHVAIASQIRYSRAQVALEPTADDRVTVSAGGLSLAVGLRLDF